MLRLQEEHLEAADCSLLVDCLFVLLEGLIKTMKICQQLLVQVRFEPGNFKIQSGVLQLDQLAWTQKKI